GCDGRPARTHSHRSRAAGRLSRPRPGTRPVRRGAHDFERRSNPIKQRRNTMKTRLAGAILGAALAALWAASAACQELPLGYLPSGAGAFSSFFKKNEIAGPDVIYEINASRALDEREMDTAVVRAHD